jgi:hypothetical protein
MWPLKKLGINNPLEIVPPVNYVRVLNWWKGAGTRPSDAEARDGILQLAGQLLIKNNIVHRDVLDAMFRQPHTTVTKPFKFYVASSKPLFATEYDLGKQGYAYNDRDTGNYWVSTSKRTEGNHGRLYRNDGVDINRCKDDISNGYCVSWTEEGEWIQYTITAHAKGIYDVTVRARSIEGTPYSLSLQSKNSKIGNYGIIKDNKEWGSIHVGKVQLYAGVNILRLKIEKGNPEINYLQFTH